MMIALLRDLFRTLDMNFWIFWPTIDTSSFYQNTQDDLVYIIRWLIDQDYWYPKHFSFYIVRNTSFIIESPPTMKYLHIPIVFLHLQINSAQNIKYHSYHQIMLQCNKYYNYSETSMNDFHFSITLSISVTYLPNTNQFPEPNIYLPPSPVSITTAFLFRHILNNSIPSYRNKLTLN